MVANLDEATSTVDGKTKTRKRPHSQDGSNWQASELKESNVSIGTLGIARVGSDLMMGKVLGRHDSTWNAHRWRARNKNAPGLEKRFFPSWQKDGRIFISAHPPRGSTPETFNFILPNLICSGFNLHSSYPDDVVIDLARRRGLSVQLVRSVL